ncbi:proton-associated sugar transporter A-like isoform X3 [Hermetia illucens]|nr:proton-associated sugar transporter A-like isoform X3 [Hermetia illucens]
MVAKPRNSQEIDINDPIVKEMLQIRENHARQQRKDYSHVFRPKSYLDFIRLSCIVVAIELAYSAETAFVSPILLQIGVDHKHMTMVWGLSPLLGFFISPILGSLSDRCRSNLGRRRPLLIALSTGIMMGLVLVPYGKIVGGLLGDRGMSSESPDAGTTNTTLTNLKQTELAEPSISNHVYGFVFTILGTILLDFNADTCQTPSRAYLLDVCIPSDHVKAMSTFSVMAGLGGTFGYSIGGIDWNSTQIGLFLGGNYQTVFAIVLVVFIICFLITVTSFREIPLDLIESDQLLRPLSRTTIQKEIQNRKNIYCIKEATSMELKLTTMKLSNGDKLKFILDNANNNNNNNNKIIKGNQAKNGDCNHVTLKITSGDEIEEKVTLRTYLKSIIFMPKSIRVLSLTNLLCHMAHLSYCLYFTDFVGEAVFGGDPSAPEGTFKAALYNEGVRFGCYGLSVYAFSCSVYSSLMERLISWTSTKTVYFGSILIFASGMLALAVWPTKPGVLIFSMCAGVIYSCLFTMPFILIAKYHSQGCFKMDPQENAPLKQSRGLGTDIAIISSMVFVGQLIVSLSMGSLITALGSTSATLYAASGAGILAALSALNVLYLD